MIRTPANWSRLAIILIPIVIVAVDAFVLIWEHLEPPAQKAIRMVRESNSRKENFTVQQYLYSTVYHRAGNGEPIVIDGWRALAESGAGSITVEFRYSDSTGEHAATWDVELKGGKVSPKNDQALDLSWH
jgi:hypothetical protein